MLGATRTPAARNMIAAPPANDAGQARLLAGKLDTAHMATDESLKRLGGGRWETRDGRFAIEPQSGTWAVVDTTQSNELGLPLVRGPFRSLTEAKAAIEEARHTGPVESPLGDRIEAGRRPAAKEEAPGWTSKKPQTASRSAASEAKEPEPVEPEPPPPPPEPKWLRDLGPADRRRARDLVERLDELEIAQAQAIARAEIALNEPALARLGIERVLRQILDRTKDPNAAIDAAIEALSGGRDRELDVRWRLVDERGRPITGIDISE